MQQGDAAEARGKACVRKAAVAGVLIKRIALIGESGDDKIRQTIVVVIGEVHAHARKGAAVSVHGNTGEESDFLKRSVTFVVIKKLDHGVVGDEDVEAAVAIVIRKGDAEP